MGRGRGRVRRILSRAGTSEPGMTDDGKLWPNERVARLEEAAGPGGRWCRAGAGRRRRPQHDGTPAGVSGGHSGCADWARIIHSCVQDAF